MMGETATPDTTNSAALSSGRRWLLCCLLPNVVFYLTLIVILASVWDQAIDVLPIEGDQPASGGTHPFIVLMLLTFSAMAGILVLSVLLVSTISAATAASYVHWRRWYTALIGGTLAVTLGCAVTAVVVYVFYLFAKAG